MKAPKYIVELATKIVDRDAKENPAPSDEQNREYYIRCKTTILMDLRNALLGRRYYTGVNSVSKSGMSRTISIGYIKNNSLIMVRCPYILQLAGCNKNWRIDGCGMDMLFAAQYNLFRTLCPNHEYQTKMPQYNRI